MIYLTQCIKSAIMNILYKIFTNLSTAKGESFAFMRRLIALTILILALALLSACLGLPHDAAPPPLPQAAHPDERHFNTVVVTRGDITLEANPFAIYMPARIESQAFASSDIPVAGIFVAVGDEVAQGDILATLDMPEIQAELAELTQRYTRLALELTLLNERQALTQQPNRAAREFLEAEIQLLQALIEHVDELNQGRYLRATMDGIITESATFIEGMISDSRQAVAVISDQAFSSFVVQGELAQLMPVGEQFEMTLAGETHLMEVIDPEEHGFILESGQYQAFLAFVHMQIAEDDEPEATGGLDLRGHWYGPRTDHDDTHGRVHMPLDEALDVLHIPTTAVHGADEHRFVYVLQDGLRAVRNVTVGLDGGGYIEIIDGLMEGELVIE